MSASERDPHLDVIRPRGVTTDEDQRVTFVELFFDLVFVYAVTQLVALLYHEPSWTGALQAVLVFWLVWWAWTQFTWALNSADTTHPGVELSVLVATAVAFLMAVVLPDAFSGGGVWFAVTYVSVRVIGLAVYSRVAWDDPAKRAALRRFALLSVGGLLAVAAGGVAPDDARVWWWAAAVGFDLFAAGVAGAAEGWDIRPDHFGERHGLFVIIALGESLIVAAAGLSGAERTAHTVAVGVLAVAGTCGLWWTYFSWAKPAIDRAVTERADPARTTLARDVYSVLHFPVVFGIVLYAVAIEAAVAHPDAPLSAGAGLALGGGITLFLGGTAAALWRTGHRAPVARLVILASVLAGLWAARDAAATWSLVIAVCGVTAVAAVESWR
jgi:low temperature requirement protein LtrA